MKITLNLYILTLRKNEVITIKFEYNKNASKYHRMVGEALEQLLDVEDVEQEKRMDCGSTHYLAKRLRVDWFIHDYKLAIEVDGELHYHETGLGDGTPDANLYNRKRLDRIKDQIAQDNGWTLLRIPYWEFEKGIEHIKQIISETIDGLDMYEVEKDNKKKYTRVGNPRKLGRKL